MTTNLIHFSRLLDRYRPYYNQSSGLKVQQHLAKLNRLEEYELNREEYLTDPIRYNLLNSVALVLVR